MVPVYINSSLLWLATCRQIMKSFRGAFAHRVMDLYVLARIRILSERKLRHARHPRVNDRSLRIHLSQLWQSSRRSKTMTKMFYQTSYNLQAYFFTNAFRNSSVHYTAIREQSNWKKFILSVHRTVFACKKTGSTLIVNRIQQSSIASIVCRIPKNVIAYFLSAKKSFFVNLDSNNIIKYNLNK